MMPISNGSAGAGVGAVLRVLRRHSVRRQRFKLKCNGCFPAATLDQQRPITTDAASNMPVRGASAASSLVSRHHSIFGSFGTLPLKKIRSKPLLYGHQCPCMVGDVAKAFSTTAAGQQAGATTMVQASVPATNSDENNRQRIQDDNHYRELLRWTDTILHPVKTPLGSLQKASVWNDVLVAMHLWLKTSHDVTETGGLAATAAAATAVSNKTALDSLIVPVPPRHVDLVDRLLVRLWYEHNCTVSSLDSNQYPQSQRTADLYDWTVALIQAWLQVSARVPDAPMAIDKARHWLHILLLNHYQPIGNNDDKNNNVFSPLVVNLWIDVIQAHQRLVDTTLAQCQVLPAITAVSLTPIVTTCRAAVDLLLDDAMLSHVIPNHCILSTAANDNGTPSATAALPSHQLKGAYQMALKQTALPSNQLKGAYQMALKQTLALISVLKGHPASVSSTATTVTADAVDLTHAASSILEAMERLALLPGWDDVKFRDADLDAVLDVLFLDNSNAILQHDSGGAIAASTNRPPPTLSNYERQALQQRIITRIDQASTVSDQQTVEDLVLYWRSNMQSGDLGHGGDTDTDVANKDSVSTWKPFAKAVTSYYLKIQDPVKATKWMQIQEQMPSADDVVDAIQSSTTSGSHLSASLASRTTPTAKGDSELGDGGGGGATKSFVELEALNRVFAENKVERVQQKMNLLDIWLTKVDSPIVPWRATEILESLESEPDVSIDASTYLAIVKKWLEVHQNTVAGSSSSTSSSHTVALTSKHVTGMASEKALELAMRCPSFDAELLSIVMQLLVDRHVATNASHSGPPHPAALNFVHLIEQNFDSIPIDQRSTLIVNAFQLLASAQAHSSAFLDFILERSVPITDDVASAAVHWVPTNVKALLYLLEKGTVSSSNDDENDGKGRPQLGFCFRRAALQHLLVHPSERHDVPSILLDAINGLSIEEPTPRQGMQLADLVNSFLKHSKIIYRDATMLETILRQTEDILLKLSPDNVDENTAGSASVPLLDFCTGAAKQLCERLKTVHVEKMVDRLRGHYRSGLVGLYPNNDIMGGYLGVLRETDWWNSLDKRIELLLELISVHEATNMKHEHYKPSYEVFDRLVGDLYKRAKSSVGPRTVQVQEPAAKAAVDYSQLERDTRMALHLLRKMHSLRIKPNNRTRVYPFNVAMDMALACPNEYSHFKIVTRLKSHLEELDIEPNIFTMQNVLKACEQAPQAKVKHQTLQSLTVMLQTLIEIRQHGWASSSIYSQCFRVFFAANHTLTPSEKKHADKMLATVFQCCINDGCLSHVVRTNFRILASRETFRRLYEESLLNGNEPKEWSRNYGKSLGHNYS